MSDEADISCCLWELEREEAPNETRRALLKFKTKFLYGNRGLVTIMIGALWDKSRAWRP